MSYSNEVLARRLKVARAKAGMSQGDLAKASGVCLNLIARYETGSVTPRLDKAFALALALGCDLDELTGLADAPTLA